MAEKKGLDIFKEISNGMFGENISSTVDTSSKEEEVEDTTEVEQEKAEEEEVEIESTKEEQEDEDDSESSHFEIFAQSLINEDVFELDTDDEGNLTKEYDSSEQGLKEMIADTVEKKYTSYISEYEESLKEVKVGNELTAKDFLDFVQKGGRPEDFIDLVSQQNYEEVDITDPDNQRYLVEDKLRLDGVDEADIEELLQEYIDSNTLSKQAKVAHNFLVKNQKEQEKTFLKEQEQRAKQREKEEEEALDKFKSTVLNADKVLNVEMSDKEKKGFLDYLTKPVKKDKNKSYTQYELDNSEEKRLEMAYMQYKGGLKNVMKNAESKESRKLLNSLSKSIDKNTLGSNSFQQEEKNPSNKKNTNPDLKGFMLI